MGIFQIHTDKAVYSTGDIVHGYIEFIKGRAIDIRGVNLEFVVTEFTHEELGEYSRVKTAILHQAKTVVFGGKNYITLNPGSHQWSFNVTIPTNLPSAISHSDNRAYVKYELKASLDSGLYREAYRQMVVISNHDIALHRPFDPPLIKGERSFLFSKGLLEMLCSTDRSLTYPGQQIFIHVKIDNDTSKKATALSLQFAQTWKYPKATEQIILREYVFKPKEFPISTGQQFKTKVGFTIPDSIPWTTMSTHMFTVKYSIIMRLFVYDTPEISLELPLTISSPDHPMLKIQKSPQPTLVPPQPQQPHTTFVPIYIPVAVPIGSSEATSPSAPPMTSPLPTPMVTPTGTMSPQMMNDTLKQIPSYATNYGALPPPPYPGNSLAPPSYESVVRNISQ